MKRRLSRQSDRRGSMLLVVLICLGVIGALVFASLNISLRQRRQLDRELQMEQTRLLAVAGLKRGTVLAKSGDQPNPQPAILVKLDSKQTAEVQTSWSEDNGRIEVTSTAWIGLKDRSETQTRQSLKIQLDQSSGE